MTDIHIHVSKQHSKATVSAQSSPGRKWMYKNMTIDPPDQQVTVDADTVDDIERRLVADGLEVEIR